MSYDHLAAGVVGFVLGGLVADAAQPIVTFVGGGSALGIAFASAWEWGMNEEPDWERAAGLGSVLGALGGAAVLVLDALAEG